MTIAQIIQHLRPGGIETMVLDWQDMTHEDQVIISLEGTKQESIAHWPRLNKYNTNLYFLNKKPGWDLSVISKLRGLLRDNNISTIHTHHIGPLIYGSVAAKVNKIHSHIHTEHDAWHFHNKKQLYLQKIALKINKPIVIADCKLVATELEAFFSNIKLSTICNGVNLDYFKPGNKIIAKEKLGFTEADYLVGSAGRLVKVKGHRYLIDAIKNLPESVHCLIAGEGDEAASLQKSIDELDLNHRVKLLGQLEDLREFYQAIDVFCLPSLMEGLPLSPLEAQACNTPVIVTNVGGNSECCCTETGTLIPAKDSQAIANAILTLQLSTPEKKPRDYIEKYHDLRTVINQYQHFYRQ